VTFGPNEGRLEAVTCTLGCALDSPPDPVQLQIPENLLPIPNDFDQIGLLAAVDRVPESKELRVVYFDGSRMFLVRNGSRVRGAGARVIVVYEMGQGVPPQHFGISAARESRFFSELLGAGLSCSAAVIAWLVVLGGAGAAPVSGGTSTYISFLGWGAAAASSAQCLNSIGRVTTEVYSPQALDWFDSQEWYTRTADALDLISLVGATASAAATLRMVLIARAANPSKSLVAILRGLSRQERKLLTEELIRAQNPGISNQRLKALVRAGIYPKRYTGAAISEGVKHQLTDALGATFSFAGSASSGVSRKFVLGVVEALED